MVKVEWFQRKISRFDGSFSLLFFKKKKRPSLVVVEKNQDISVFPDGEKKLYDALCKCNYYVTPNKKLGKHSINFALVPFRIAIMEETKMSKRLKKKLIRNNWNIVYYSEKELHEDFFEIIRRINSLASNFLSEVK